tara:strand:- start:471 stop:815 length:345 start_codon:yes stop_codon:yes gene_type:complete
VFYFWGILLFFYSCTLLSLLSGTGKMTVKQGADQGVACPTMASALDQRFVSFLKDDRTAASEILTGPTEGELLFFYSCLFFHCPHPSFGCTNMPFFNFGVVFNHEKKKRGNINV